MQCIINLTDMKGLNYPNAHISDRPALNSETTFVNTHSNNINIRRFIMLPLFGSIIMDMNIIIRYNIIIIYNNVYYYH